MAGLRLATSRRVYSLPLNTLRLVIDAGVLLPLTVLSRVVAVPVVDA